MDDGSKEARIAVIADLMARNQWPTFPDALSFRRKLAEEWGISEHTVRGYAAEAHRRVALDPDERAQLQERLGRNLLAIADEARVRENVVTGMPDYGSAIRATETAAKFLGIEFESKVKVSGAISLESIDEIRKRIDGGDDSAEGSGGAG